DAVRVLSARRRGSGDVAGAEGAAEGAAHERQRSGDTACHCGAGSGGVCPGSIDLVHGGPPCQPASAAGKRAGSSDSRWRWPEFLRIIGELQPRWVLAENPTGLVSLRHGDGAPAFGRILAELAALGYRVGY